MKTLLVLLSLALAAPALAQPEVGRGVAFTYEPGGRPGQAGAPSFEHRSYEVLVALDGDDGLTVDYRFELTAASRAAFPAWVPVAVLDRAAGDRCDTLGLDGDDDLEVKLLPAGDGFDHLGSPAICAVGPVDPKARRLQASVQVVRPSQPLLGEATAWLAPVQPLFGAAKSYRFAVEGGSEADAVVRPHGWTMELASESIARDRWRWSTALDGVLPLRPQPGQVTITGRAPQWSVATLPDWHSVAALHRRVFDAAAEAHGPVLPLAGRVLGIRDPVQAVKEAVRIALGTITLQPEGGTGGLFQAPQPPEQTVDSGTGRAIDRAALLVSLLRTAELRAEVVYASPTALDVGPESPVQPLGRVLVLVPGISLEAGGSPLYIDPSRGPNWLGALDEELLGVNALLVAPDAARWLRLPAEPPLRRWAWSAAETRTNDFQVQVTGRLEGAPAARVRDWNAGGRTGQAPDALAFVRDLPVLDALEIDEASGGRLQVVYSGTLSRADLLQRDGTLRIPALPDAARGPAGKAWSQPRDALRFDLDATESWTFRGLRSGSAPRTDEKTTPFWQVDAAASWSGPVFSRRYRLRFTARELGSLAARNLEGFGEHIDQTLGGIKAPPPPR